MLKIYYAKNYLSYYFYTYCISQSRKWRYQKWPILSFILPKNKSLDIFHIENTFLQKEANIDNISAINAL